METAYNDNWGTCWETYVTLCIYPQAHDTADLTSQLGITPTEAQTKGVDGAKVTAWLLESKDNVQSKDIRRHLDWLLDQITPLQSKLNQLRSEKAEIFISCFWSSVEGHGGPVISPSQFDLLTTLQLELHFDIY